MKITDVLLIVLIITVMVCWVYITKAINQASENIVEEITTTIEYNKVTSVRCENNDIKKDIHDIMMNLDGSLDDILYYMKK